MYERCKIISLWKKGTAGCPGLDNEAWQDSLDAFGLSFLLPFFHPSAKGCSPNAGLISKDARRREMESVEKRRASMLLKALVRRPSRCSPSVVAVGYSVLLSLLDHP